MSQSSISAIDKQVLLDALNRCVAACEHCATSCLAEEHMQHMAGCIRVSRDCADICALTARLVARDSEHAKHIMQECIEVCQLCQNECGKHQHEHCQQCAAACMACADACRAYLG